MCQPLLTPNPKPYKTSPPPPSASQRPPAGGGGNRSWPKLAHCLVKGSQANYCLCNDDCRRSCRAESMPGVKHPKEQPGVLCSAAAVSLSSAPLPVLWSCRAPCITHRRRQPCKRAQLVESVAACDHLAATAALQVQHTTPQHNTTYTERAWFWGGVSVLKLAALITPPWPAWLKCCCEANVSTRGHS